MAGFISVTEQAGILATFSGSFDTWKRDIVVYKEPLKTLVDPQPQGNNVFGFGEQQQDPVYSYTPRSGVFSAIIRYNDIERNPAKNAPLSPEILARIYWGPVSIKVERNCRDFINDGVTERILVDGNSYLMDSDERLQTYQGSEYYIYSLRKTK